jgi:hypothetical protein
MLRIDRKGQRLTLLETPTFSDVKLTERYDLQEMISKNPQAFFSEMGEDLFLIGNEVEPTENVRDRIDLLAIDDKGCAVIIEIKRGSERLQLLQAIAYAGMVAKWNVERFTASRSQFATEPIEIAKEAIADFLRGETSEVNTAQRIVLLAEDFDYEVLVGAEWLSDRHEVDIRCYRLSLSKHGEDEFLSCVRVFPPAEITDHAARRGGGAGTPSGRWRNWEEALEPVTNPAVRGFFQRVIAAGWQSNLRARNVRAKVSGKRFASIDARQRRAYVWQYRRFPGDVEFWNDRIGPHVEAKEVWEGRRVRFYLETLEDFARFEELLKTELPKQDFDNFEEPTEGGTEA